MFTPDPRTSQVDRSSFSAVQESGVLDLGFFILSSQTSSDTLDQTQSKGSSPPNRARSLGRICPVLPDTSQWVGGTFVSGRRGNNQSGVTRTLPKEVNKPTDPGLP